MLRGRRIVVADLKRPDYVAAAPAPRFSRSRTAAAESPSASTIEDALDAWARPRVSG